MFLYLIFDVSASEVNGLVTELQHWYRGMRVLLALFWLDCKLRIQYSWWHLCVYVCVCVCVCVCGVVLDKNICFLLRCESKVFRHFTFSRLCLHNQKVSASKDLKVYMDGTWWLWIMISWSEGVPIILTPISVIFRHRQYSERNIGPMWNEYGETYDDNDIGNTKPVTKRVLAFLQVYKKFQLPKQWQWWRFWSHNWLAFLAMGVILIMIQNVCLNFVMLL